MNFISKRTKQIISLLFYMETEVFVHLMLLSCITISNANNIWKAMRNEEGRESTKLLKS